MSTSSTSSLFTPLEFTGISQYSSDFQSILSRAVSIAELPAEQLQQQEASITEQESDLSSISSDVSGVQSALQALGQLGSGGGLSATSSDSSVVSATSTGATASGTYTINNVTSLATAASEMSSKSYASENSTPVSANGTMTLVYGSKTYSITLTGSDNNLQGLENAINSLDAGVSASVITTSSGDYLSVSANSTGATTLQLNDVSGTTSSNILTDKNQGSNTDFELNGVSVSEPSTTVSDVVPGVTFNFTGTTSSAVTVGVSTDASSISNALQQLVSSYNTLLSADQGEMGTSGGSLAGNNLIYQIGSALTSIVQYQGGTSGMSNLANLGIEIGDNGQMTFNQTTFDSLSSSQISSALSLLGSSTTGIGGLQQDFAALTDPTTGSITEQEQQWQSQVTALQNQISDMSTQVQDMEQTLNSQLQAADASVAELSSQQSILTASITSLDYTAYGYNTNSSTSQTT